MENYVPSKDENVSLWTEITGEAKHNHVMLCNGGPGSPDYLASMAEMMDDSTSVIRFEQRACGRSTMNDQCDVATTISDLECIRNYYHIKKWIVGGHSWGANLALAYALRHPERVMGLIYCSGNGVQRNREWSEAYHKNRDTFGERMPVMNYPGNDEVNKLGNKSWQEYIQDPLLLKKISQLDIPTLFLYGSRDIRPSWPAEQISNLMPNSQFTMIKDAEHYIWLTHYDEMKSILHNFTKSIIQEVTISAENTPHTPHAE